MDPMSGRIMTLSSGMSIPTGFEPVPAHLNHAAQRKLNGKSEATVSMSSGGKLSKWARSQRKNKRKQTAESRRRNR